MTSKNLFHLDGKISLVTGGGKGLGKEIAITLAREGSKVAVCARTKIEIDKVSREINSFGGEAISIKMDVRSERDVKRAFEKVIEKWDRIDILVNNAGISHLGKIIELSIEDWEKVIKTNLTGVFICSKYAAKYMIEQRYGKIINISSTAGIRGGILQSAYHVAKAGIIMLTKCLALELAPYHINVNCVAPGYIRTQESESNISNFYKFLDRIPLKRFGDAKDVAILVAFLASDKSNYITGQTIIIDGGLTIGL